MGPRALPPVTSAVRPPRGAAQVPWRVGVRRRPPRPAPPPRAAPPFAGSASESARRALSPARTFPARCGVGSRQRVGGAAKACEPGGRRPRAPSRRRGADNAVRRRGAGPPAGSERRRPGLRAPSEASERGAESRGSGCAP